MALLASRSSATSALRAQRPCVKAPLVAPRPMVCKPRVGHVRASSEGSDFDAILMKWADKFEKSNNKPTIIGYVAAAAGAFFFAEWLIHLPALDIILGFPVQLLGLLVLPTLVTRYVLDGKDASKDVGDAVADITKRLPGLDK